MSQETIEAPPIRGPRPARRVRRKPAPRRLLTARSRRTAIRWLLGRGRAAARSRRCSSCGPGARPGYDPYGWLVWGKLLVHAKLDTNGAPSWKPLPFLFTAPYALVGHYALWLWMITSVAVSLSGLVFAWRIAFRLTERPAASAATRHTRRARSPA